MTDINDGHSDARPSKPADPAFGTEPYNSASADTPPVDNPSGKHPGIVIRPGPTGPRAALSDGPDVWEVIAAWHALRDEDPTLHGEVLARELCTVTGLRTAQIAAALDYYTTHPADIDKRIAANEEATEREQPATDNR